jgi:CSLREA domain-containing protein
MMSSPRFVAPLVPLVPAIAHSWPVYLDGPAHESDHCVGPVAVTPNGDANGAATAGVDGRCATIDLYCKDSGRRDADLRVAVNRPRKRAGAFNKPLNQTLSEGGTMTGDVILKSDRAKSRWIVLVMSVALLAGRRADARTFVVDSTVDAVDAAIGDGRCATDEGSCTLRAAVNEANDTLSRDTIVLPAGTYMLTIPPGDVASTSLSGDLDLWGDLKIRGAGADVTIIDANRLDRAFHVLQRPTGPVRVELRGVSVVNGAPPENHGGGISATNADLRLVQSVVAENAALIGGGIESIGGRTTLERSRVADNVGNGGAGIRLLLPGARLVLKRSTVSGNQTQAGSFPGAGIFCFPGTELVVSNSVVTGNRSGDGGAGIMFGGARGRIFRTTIQGNEAGTGGGGVSLYREPGGDPPGPLGIYGSQIVENVAATAGGGIWTAPPTWSSDSPPLLHDTTVARNVDLSGAAPDCSGEILDGGNVVIGNPTGCTLSPP